MHLRWLSSGLCFKRVLKPHSSMNYFWLVQAKLIRYTGKHRWHVSFSRFLFQLCLKFATYQWVNHFRSALFVQKFKANLHERSSCGCNSVHLLFCLGLALCAMLVLLLWQQSEVEFIVRNSLETSFERCSG